MSALRRHTREGGRCICGGVGAANAPTYTDHPLSNDLFLVDSCMYYIQRFVAYLWLDGVNLGAQFTIWMNDHAVVILLW
ncbi:MAG: hypothetical protein ACFE9C_18670 [Candidatus Hodarchaeota archaeon]